MSAVCGLSYDYSYCIFNGFVHTVAINHIVTYESPSYHAGLRDVIYDRKTWLSVRSMNHCPFNNRDMQRKHPHCLLRMYRNGLVLKARSNVTSAWFLPLAAKN